MQASYYQVYGCRDLTVEMDASYIKGMLDNPSSGPNATINQWIEEIQKYHFTLVHVKGIKHGPNGLSRIMPGGWQPTRPYENPDYDDKDNGEPLPFRMGKGETEEPLNFEDFKHEIDSRGGYMATISDRALSTDDFKEDIQEASDLE